MIAFAVISYLSGYLYYRLPETLGTTMIDEIIELKREEQPNDKFKRIKPGIEII